MKIDRANLELALANNCMSMSELRKDFSPSTLSKLRNDPDYCPTPKTIGKLARALKVEVKSLVKEVS